MEWQPDEIKALRKKLSLSQRQFAKRLGVKRQTVARWETGRRTPSKEIIAELEKLATKNVASENVASENVASENVASENVASENVTDENVNRDENVSNDRVEVTSDRPDKFDPAYITNVLELLHGKSDGIVEVRIFPNDRYLNINGHREWVGKTVSGYYTDVAKIAQDVKAFDGKGNIYFTLNPVNPDLLARAANRLKYSVETTTKDNDILSDRWLPIDIDPVRPKDVSSTDEELKLALKTQAAIVTWLDKFSIPTITGMSGNGAHILIPLIGYPNSQETRQAKEQFIHFLSDKFSSDKVSVDSTVFNMARIWKLYGTLAVKGDNIPERPHRRAWLNIPELQPEPIDLYAMLPEILPKEEKEPKQKQKRERKKSQASISDQELIEKAKNAKNGAKFTALWGGDTSGYDSQSEADLALCAMLAFWTGGDFNRIDRLFRQSSLFREKWDEPRASSTYGWNTIDKALKEVTEFYEPHSSSSRQKSNGETQEKTQEEDFEDFDLESCLDSIEDDIEPMKLATKIEALLFIALKAGKSKDILRLWIDNEVKDKFNLTARDAQSYQAMLTRLCKEHEEATRTQQQQEKQFDGRHFGNIYEVDGYNVEGNRKIGYFKEGQFSTYPISTFIIKPKSKLWIDGYEAVSATFISASAEMAVPPTASREIEDVVIERQNWNSVENFMNVIPSTDMNWSGEGRKEIQSVMSIVSSYDIPVQVATQQIGWHKDQIWVAPNLNMGNDGLIEPVKVFYYPMGRHNVIDDIVSYKECTDERFAELQEQAKRLLELNESDVIIPVIGWFHGACSKRWWMDCSTLEHFPHLNIAGSRGSGKSTLAEILWRVFGWTGDALPSCSASRFALLRTFSSTNSYPIVLDEFKPANMQKDRVANSKEFMRHSYGGTVDQRGRPDQSIVEYNLTAPICLVGETPYYPLEAAAIERVIPVHMNINAINPETELGSLRADLCYELQQIDWTGYLPRYIRYLMTIDFGKQVEWAREDAVRYRGSRDIPRRIWDNIAAMIFGLRQYENFVGVKVDDGQIESAVKQIATNLCGEAGNRGKLAFELALEQMAVMAETGRLRNGVHYLILGDQIALRLFACLSEFRRFARETNWTGEVLDDDAYRRQIQEIYEEGGLVVETSKQVRGWQGDTYKRARGVIFEKDSNLDLEGFFLASLDEEED